jgi:hypothetical protein
LDIFLSSRCSKDFLIQYIEEYPDLLNRASSPGLFLDTVSEVDLAIRLHELGLLPEKYRKDFVTKVTTYAIQGEDLYALESLQIQSVFTPDELFEFHASVRANLVPNLAEVRAIWQSNHNSEEPADEHIRPLLDSFAALKEEFADEPAIIGKIDREIERIKEWISERVEGVSRLLMTYSML